MKIYFTLIFISIPAILTAQWQWQNPKPLGDEIQQVLFIDNQTGWMIPSNTTLLKTIDGGVNWETIYTNIFFNNIFFLDKDEGWGIGRKHFVPEFTNTIYHTTNGGLNWEIQLADTTVYYNIRFTDKNNGWATTRDAWTTALHTSDGGKTWVEKALYQFRLGDGAGPFWVMFVDTLKGWIVGGHLWAIKTVDGGNTWQRDSSLAGMKKIIAIDSLNFWTLSGGNPIAKSSDGGNSWNFINYDNSTTERYTTEIFALDTNRIFVSTSIGFYGSTDGGSTWSKFSDEDINGFAFISDNEIWGGGRTNHLSTSIVHSTDGGHNWDNLIETNNPLGYSSYADVDFVDNNTGWIISGLNILNTTNRGESWTEQSSPTSRGLTDILMIDQNNGYIAGRGGTILKTMDGGMNWVSKVSNTNYTLKKLDFINDNTGWIVGDNDSDFTGIILKTTDGGNNWINQTPSNTPRLVGVSFIDSLKGWAISGGGSAYDHGEILHTTDGGNSWSIQDWGFQYDLTEVLFVDSTKGFILGYDPLNRFSVYKTLNGGNTWQNTSFNPGALYDIKFVNKDSGWIVGEFGNIYSTSDGGDNWKEQLSFTHQDLYAIDFIDEKNGWVVGWWGTILHTTNGGITSVDNKERLNSVPENCLLYQNYPNPFNASTTIQYQLSESGFIILKIYDLLGKEVITLVNKEQTAGRYEVNFNASNLASGIYFYQIKSDSFVLTKKIVYLK